MGKTTRHLVLNTIEHAIDIAAPPEKVWDLIRDPRRVSRWSPQVLLSVAWGGGTPGPGMQFVTLNRRGVMVYPTRSVVVRFEPGVEVAWKVLANDAVWSFTVEPSGQGTRLVQRRELPDGLSELSISLTDRFLGGQPQFQADLQQGMRETLAWIKQEAER